MSRNEYLTIVILVIPAFVLGWAGGWLWANRVTTRQPSRVSDLEESGVPRGQIVSAPTEAKTLNVEPSVLTEIEPVEQEGLTPHP
jgi:hypothetical protein